MAQGSGEENIRIGISVQVCKVNCRRRIGCAGQVQARPVGILVGVEQHVDAVVGVIACRAVVRRGRRKSGATADSLSSTAVRLQHEDIGPRTGRDVEGRHGWRVVKNWERCDTRAPFTFFYTMTQVVYYIMYQQGTLRLKQQHVYYMILAHQI